MLVLSRREFERVLIGDDIVITIVRIGPVAVRIGIDAPAALRIVRDDARSQHPPAQHLQEKVA